MLKSLGSDLDPHAEAAEHAAAEAATAPEIVTPTGPTTPSTLILPDRPAGTAEGREAIRKLLESKE